MHDDTITQNNNSETAIIPPLRFRCLVNGNLLDASITGDTDHPVHIQYRVQFTDGYEDLFSLLEDRRVQGENVLRSAPYAAAIQEDLQSLGYFNREDEIYVWEQTSDGQLHNTWVKGVNEEGRMIYSVYSGGDYRFELMQEKGKWKSRTRRRIEGEPVDKEIALSIIEAIEKGGISFNK